MASLAIRKDEQLALVLALAAHAVLFAWLAWQRPAPPPPLPERMTVTLADEFGPLSTSPEPDADPAPDMAPVLGDTPPEPEAVAKPEPKPSPKPIPSPKAASKQPPKNLPKKGGASDFDSAFAPGVAGASGKQQTKIPPAAAPSALQTASWDSSIKAKVRRPWDTCAPSGLDAEKLRITVHFTLDRFGGIASMEEPIVTGITESNRPQVNVYKNCAVRAIRVAAPFDNLPQEFYEAWKPRKLNFRKDLRP